MPINFKGASNFTITGGNFGNIKGDIYTVHIPQPLGYEQVDLSSLSSSRSRRATPARSSRRPETKKSRSQHYVEDTGPPLLLPPPEPTVSALVAVPATATAAPPGPTTQFPAVTFSPLADLDIQEDEDGNGSDSSGTSGYDGYFTPRSDTEGDLEGESDRSSTIAMSPVTHIQSGTVTSLPPPIHYSQRHRHSGNQSQTRTSLRGIGRTVSESTSPCHNYGSGPSPDTIPLHPRGPRSFTVPLPTLDSSTQQQVRDSNSHHTPTTSGHFNREMSHGGSSRSTAQPVRYRNQADCAYYKGFDNVGKKVP
ncbi:hypothetical protein P691DRAFT_778442 [Macrolepiota fuliginosa MF-IS2]|uniref:Uncharacterized protein n=1 Tax=Macrolepiota fuliginosa MF-IS2 TaxID=1400762 RepID=A0A9P6C092_9AGAR|nr:hypothetical protein P691DRAFT_778442 [Macrolepiota fuliginosa MF-IS2]